MKIMMVHPHDIYHNLEPWTVRITYLAQELVNAGHEVRLAYHLFDPHQDVDEANLRQKYPFETIPLHRNPYGLYRNFKRLGEVAFWADIIHFQKCSNYAAIPTLAAAYLHGRPIHYDWDDWEQAIFEKDNRNPIGSWIYFQQMEKHLLKVVDTLSIASNGLKRLSKQMNFPEERTFFIPVGADMDVFSPGIKGDAVREKYNLDKKVVLYHGQISGSNYVSLYLKTAQSVLKTRNDVTFLVVGGGDRLKDAQKLAHDLNITDHVLFTDKVSHKHIPQFIAAADVAIATFEDNKQVRCKSPLKVVEYMASGKAIVASAVGDVPSMIGDCGLLVSTEDFGKMAESVSRLLDDSELRTGLGKKARTRALETLSWQHSARTLIQAYYTALKYHHCL